MYFLIVKHFLSLPSSEDLTYSWHHFVTFIEACLAQGLLCWSSHKLYHSGRVGNPKGPRVCYSEVHSTLESGTCYLQRSFENHLWKHHLCSKGILSWGIQQHVITLLSKDWVLRGLWKIHKCVTGTEK